SRGLANSPLDCWLPGCGQAGLVNSSSQQPNSDPRGGARHAGRFLGKGEGSLPRPGQQSTGLLAAWLRPGRPVRLLFTATKQQPPWRDTPWGLLFGAGEGSRTLVLSLEG